MNILHLFTSELGSNPRPTRFYKELRKFGNVTVASKKPPQESYLAEVDFLLIDYFDWDKCTPPERYDQEIWSDAPKRALLELSKKQFSLIVCQDLHFLPLAATLKSLEHNKNCRLIMDAREFYPKQYDFNPAFFLYGRGIVDYVCKKFLSFSDVIFTVSPGLKKGFKDDYGLDCILLPSLSYYHEITPHKTTDSIRCIHHGGATPGRKLELMVYAFAHLEGVASLDLMLVPTSQDYFNELKKLAAGTTNVKLIPTVPMPEIVSFISQYDLGIYLLPQNSFNHNHAWPNKFFEFIQARLGIIVSPVEDMSNFVAERKIGISTLDFSVESLIAVMSILTPETIDFFKQRSHDIAKEMSWESNSKIIQDTIKSLIGK